MSGVISLENILPPVRQPAVSKDEPQPAVGKVPGVLAGDAIGDKGDSGAIILSFPHAARKAGSELKGLVDFGIGPGFGLAVVPSKTSVSDDVSCQDLLEVDPKAVLRRHLLGVVGDVRRHNLSLQVLFVRDLVNAHVGVVDICQQTDNSILLTEEPAVQFEFDIRGVGIAQVPNQIWSVRNTG